MDELIDSQIKHFSLLTKEEIFGIKKILGLDDDFSFDCLMLFDKGDD
jgi:hypothetical protein